MEASGSRIVSDEELSKADADFARGLAALQAELLEDAVQFFGQALQVRVAKYGVHALECAESYLRYGAALFQKAQGESDVFGAPLQTAVAAQEGPEGKPTDGAVQPQLTAEVDPKGKGVASAPSTVEADHAEDLEGEEVEEEDKDEEDEEGSADDMQLAYENLEVARAIYSRQPDTCTKELADVRMLLADLAIELENFETALEELKLALPLLSSVLKASDRRLAEVHFKLSMTQQFLHRPEEALKEARLAEGVCKARLAELKAQNASDKEIEDLQEVMDDLKEKQAELKEEGQELQKTRDLLRSAFQQAVGGGPSLSGGGAGIFGGGVGAASGGAGVFGGGAGAGGSGGSSQVVDLGVVGQGRKRINLAPLAQPSGSAGASQPATRAAKPKRTLDDLMGDSPGGETGFGFGALSSAAPTKGEYQGEPAKKARLNEEQPGSDEEPKALPTPALPAFLQPSSVRAVYGEGSKANGTESATTEK